LLERGVGFDSSSIPRFRDVHQGDMAAKPDTKSCFVDPAWDVPTLSILADIVEAGTGAESSMDPRTTLKRAVKRLEKTGGADCLMCVPELEFYLFRKAEYGNNPFESWYRLDVPGSNCPVDDELSGIPGRPGQGAGYLATGSLDVWRNERRSMASAMATAGLPVKYHHVEAGGAGQQEIELCFQPALEAADSILLGKYLVRSTAENQGVFACFLPKPIAGAPGSGLHIHFKLLKDEKNVLAGNGYGGLSDLGRFFVGGMLKHGRALCAFLAPTTNSYRRLLPGFETPVRFFYSSANREAAVRIPKYSVGENVDAEFRVGDATMNPYLGIAALLLAGIDGMVNKIDPSKGNFGPFDGAPPEIDRAGYPECFLPGSLEESLDALEKDKDFLLQDGVFSEELIRNYVSWKWEEEVRPLSGAPHPLEYEMYWGL
jgi:glutamine synthetase